MTDSLETLAINNSDLNQLPEEILGLSNLTSLYLGDNPSLATLPTEISQLSKLSYLSLGDNPSLSALPIEALVSMENLSRISVANTPLAKSADQSWKEQLEETGIEVYDWVDA